MIKNIVFDMGNVLLDYNPEVILNKACSSEEEKNTIRKELFEGPEWVLGDKGEMTNADRFEPVSKRIPESMHKALLECVEHWDICMDPQPGAKDFLKKVREAGFHTYVLSNAADNFYEYFPKEYDMDAFDGIVVSCDLLMLKPDHVIYEYLLKKYDLVPEECLFIDDRAENVQGAIGCGMNAVQFKNNYDEIWEKIKDFTV